MKRIALIAHDRMKSQLAEFVARHRDFLRRPSSSPPAIRGACSKSVPALRWNATSPDPWEETSRLGLRSPPGGCTPSFSSATL